MEIGPTITFDKRQFLRIRGKMATEINNAEKEGK